MMTAIDTVTSDESDTVTGPGDRLRMARIEQGLSIGDVADRMYLSVSLLKAIENNDFDQVTAPIFVKGYLRTYARLVSLDETEIIQQYVTYYSDEDPPINSISNTSSEISFGDSRIKGITYILIFVLCCLLATWWWKWDESHVVVSLDIEASDEISVDPTIDVIPEDEVDVPITPEDNMEIESVKPAVAEPVIATDALIVDSVPEVNEEVVMPSDEGVIALTIRADSWVDIEDVNGEKLSYDLLYAGQQLTLKGQAPFKVFLGNGHGVEMTYNNEVVDISGYIGRGNTARLKLDRP